MEEDGGLAPDTATAFPFGGIEAYDLPWSRAKNNCESVWSQQTLLTSRLWSQQYWPPWLAH